MSDAHLKSAAAEYAGRLARTPVVHGREGMDLLIVSESPQHGLASTGYDGWSSSRAVTTMCPLQFRMRGAGLGNAVDSA